MALIDTLNLPKNFYVTSSGDIEGSYALILAPTAPLEMRRAALAAGYAPPNAGDFIADNKQLELRGILRGKRYKSNGFKPQMKEYYLNKSYEIPIEAEQSYERKLANIPLSPITIAADGTVAIIDGAAQIALAPLGLLMLGITFGVLMSQ